MYEKIGGDGHGIAKMSYILGGFIMFNTAFISLLGGTRFFYGMAKNKEIINHLSPYNTPDVIILITFILAVGLSLLQNEVILAILSNFTVIIILILLNVSYLRIKWNEAQEEHNILSVFILKNLIFILSLIILILLFIKIIQLKYKGII